MKVEVKIDPGCSEVLVSVTAPAMTEEVGDVLRRLEMGAAVLAGFREGRVTLLEPGDILCLRTAGDRVEAVTAAGDYTVRDRLYELEGRLGRDFVRVSQSEIVQLKKVRDLDLSLAGTIRMTLEGGVTVYVSRRYVKRIKEVLGL